MHLHCKGFKMICRALNIFRRACNIASMIASMIASFIVFIEAIK